MENIELVNNIDKIMYYINNLNINELLINFYDKKELTMHDTYYIEKINMLTSDFLSFWISLDEENKNKFINVVINYKNNKNKEYNVNMKCKLRTEFNNGKPYLIMLKK